MKIRDDSVAVALDQQQEEQALDRTEKLDSSCVDTTALLSSPALQEGETSRRGVGQRAPEKDAEHSAIQNNAEITNRLNAGKDISLFSRNKR